MMIRRLAFIWVLAITAIGLHSGSNTNLVLFNQRVYQTRVEPALLKFLRSKDSRDLIELIRPLAVSGSEGLPNGRWGFSKVSLYQAAIDLLSGKPGHDDFLILRDGKRRISRTVAIRKLVEGDLSQSLVNELCLIREGGEFLEFNIWDSKLSKLLYSNSPWIKDQFWGMTPGVEYSFRFSSYSGSGPLPCWFVHDFSRELQKIDGSELSGDLQKELAMLKRILDLASNNHDYRLVLEY